MLQEPSKVLDRGGKPTVRELLASLMFDPNDGTIRLNGDRVVMQRAAAIGELRRELTRLLGAAEARVFLLRLGFLSGQADAKFVRRSWPHLDTGDAFTAGTRLHTFSGVVRVETVFNTYDLRKKRFSAEFLWHDSVEASEYLRTRPSTDPVCWTQLGYASGYASEFFDTLIIYKEVECAAQGHSHCRVVGKPADVWGSSDPEVALFRERIIAVADSASPESQRKAAARTAESALSELDRLILAPVQDALDRLARMTLPTFIHGASGTGRSRAAAYLHRAAGGKEGDMRRIFGGQVNIECCAEIAAHARRARKGSGLETIQIDAVESVPLEIQPHLARALEEGMLTGGPRIIALCCHGGEHGPTSLSPDLRSVLGAVQLAMPALSARPIDQRQAIAQETLALLSARMGLRAPRFDAEALALVGQGEWRGNLRQMRSVLSAVLAEQTSDEPITAQALRRALARFPAQSAPPTSGAKPGLEPLLDDLMERGEFSLPDFEKYVYRAALDHARGNMSAAARLLGLTRAQLSYRVGAPKDGD